MVISLMYFGSVFLETFLLCTPVQYNWDKTIPNSKCHNQNLAYLLAGITNLVIDAIIVSLPMPKLYGLQMPLAKRVAIGAMFGLGALVLSIRSWIIEDSSYTATTMAIYSVLEPNLGVVNACLPTVRPAFRQIFKNGPFGWSHKNKKSVRESNSPSTQSNQHSSTRKYACPHQFEPLGDNVPLTNIYGSRSPQGAHHEGDNITIMREWEVSLSYHNNSSSTQEY
ncbi:hypothetical protein HD806DRAFT_527620 [Xylariaceae sp. AK1471]|nr:hypothetical protein HD806DRAFT_527620 [Xylariaceae sp. AK1471]